MGCGSSKPSGSGGVMQKVGDGVGVAAHAVNPLQLLETKGDVKSRCNVMLREATVTATKLKGQERELKALLKVADAALDVSKYTLDSILPNVYADNDAANAVTKPSSTLGGAGYAPDVFAKARNDLNVKLQAEAFVPMTAWLAKYDQAVTKQKAVNKAYEEQESNRSKLNSMMAKLEKLRSKAGDPKVDRQFTDASKAAETQKGKLQTSCDKHTTDEAAQFALLSALNTEAAQLKLAIRAALGLVAEAMAAARDAVPASVAPQAATPAAVPAAAPQAVPLAVPTPPPVAAAAPPTPVEPAPQP